MFSCFHNPPNFDMNYRILNMHTFLCVRIHTGVWHWHTDNKSAQHFDLKKLSQIFLCSGRDSISNLWSWNPLDLYQLSHHVPRWIHFKFFSAQTWNWMCAIHTKGGQAQTSLHKSWLGGTEKENCPSPCPTMGSDPGSLYLNYDFVTTELCHLLCIFSWKFCCTLF